MTPFKWLARLGIGDRVLIRNVQSGVLLENFLISAVAAVLVIRLYLYFSYQHLVTYIPIAGQITVGQFHFAHVLLGGFLMLVGFILVFTFLGRPSQGLGAIIGGIGFGAFIDELGKFITLNTDYFFQPAMALIYIIFVMLFIGLRAIRRPQKLSQQAALVNVLEYVQQAALRDLSSRERRDAMSLLEQCDPDDPIVLSLRHAIARVHTMPLGRPSILERGSELLRSTYSWLIRRWWFTYTLVGIFVVQSLGGLYQSVFTVTWLELLIGLVVVAILGVALLFSIRYFRSPLKRAISSASVILIVVVGGWGVMLHLQKHPVFIFEWVQMIAPTVSGLLVMFGILLIWHSRVLAYRMFYYAVLVAILITQVFAFYEEQIMAVTGLFLNVLILMALRFMIDQEESRLASTAVRRDTVSKVRESSRPVAWREKG